MFGVIGFIIGPIIAALFVTVWEIYGEVFRELLVPGGTPTPSSGPKKPAEATADGKAVAEKAPSLPEA